MALSASSPQSGPALPAAASIAAALTYPVTVLDGGFHVFPFQTTNPTDADAASAPRPRYCFTLSLAHLLGVSTSAIGVTLARHLPHWRAHVLRPGQGHGKRQVKMPVHAKGSLDAGSEKKESQDSDSADSAEVAFRRLKQTYVLVKTALHGTVEAGTAAKSDQLNLYPMPLVAALLQHYEGKASGLYKHVTPTLNAVLHHQQHDNGEIKVKLEPVDPGRAATGLDDQRPDDVTEYRDGIPVIDLTREETVVEVVDRQQDMVLGTLLDNFVMYKSTDPKDLLKSSRGRGGGDEAEDDDAWLQHYGMTAEDISETLAAQFKRFSAYRQEIWNWNRDSAGAVTEKTTSNNLRVFLLFGGFLSKVYHDRGRVGLSSSRSIDLSIFASKHMEQYAMGFLHYLHGQRQLAFSTISNYLNALVVLAKFYFATEPLADVSFASDRVDGESALAGLRRLRAQTNAKAKVETLHKPLHTQWISWHECQETRRRCIEALLTRTDKSDEAHTDKESGKDEKKRSLKSKKATDKDVLKSLVLLLFYTIAPPPRCSIVRLLQWNTTLVKRAKDPSRYVIDLRSNPDAPAAKHKTVKFYRHGVLPLPRMMTQYLDAFYARRSSRDSSSRKPDDWVFLNAKGQSYTTDGWTRFVQSCFRKYHPQHKSPNGSLTRSIFVTWLNGLPYDARDRPFLERKLAELKMSAAQYQTHSLAIANKYYDKDLASEEKLRELVNFCEAYAQSSSSLSLSDEPAPLPPTAPVSSDDDDDKKAQTGADDSDIDDEDSDHAAASNNDNGSDQVTRNKKKRQAETESDAGGSGGRNNSKRQHIESKAPDSGHTFGAFAVGDKVTVWYHSPQSSALFWRAQVTAADAESQTFSVHIRELVENLADVAPSRLTPGYLAFAT